jgi:hypothetical protein
VVVQDTADSWFLLMVPTEYWFLLMIPTEYWFLLMVPTEYWFLLMVPATSIRILLMSRVSADRVLYVTDLTYSNDSYICTHAHV